MRSSFSSRQRQEKNSKHQKKVFNSFHSVCLQLDYISSSSCMWSKVFQERATIKSAAGHIGPNVFSGVANAAVAFNSHPRCALISGKGCILHCYEKKPTLSPKKCISILLNCLPSSLAIALTRVMSGCLYMYVSPPVPFLLKWYVRNASGRAWCSRP